MRSYYQEITCRGPAATFHLFRLWDGAVITAVDPVTTVYHIERSGGENWVVGDSVSGRIRFSIEGAL